MVIPRKNPTEFTKKTCQHSLSESRKAKIQNQYTPLYLYSNTSPENKNNNIYHSIKNIKYTDSIKVMFTAKC